MENYIIYKHTNNINKKVYIGQTKQKPNRRWQNGKGYIHNPIFYNAIQKYGWDNFEHEILKDNLTLEEANYWEEYYIKLYNSTDSNYGYNCRKGGDNFAFNEETKQKMSLNHADVSGANNPMYNKHHTEETKEKIRQAALGRHTHWNEKSKENVSGGKNHWSQQVYCIELNMTFDSITEAARYINLKSSSTISSYLSGRQKSAGKHPVTKEPLHWKYVNKNLDKDKE